MTDEVVLYKTCNSNLIMNMNMLNMYSTYYLCNKHGILVCIPHGCICITSYFFWRNPRRNYIMFIDYFVVLTSIVLYYYASVLHNKDTIVSYGILLALYINNMSNYFKYLKKNEEYAVYVHSLNYLLANIGVIYIYN